MIKEFKTNRLFIENRFAHKLQEWRATWSIVRNQVLRFEVAKTNSSWSKIEHLEQYALQAINKLLWISQETSWEISQGNDHEMLKTVDHAHIKHLLNWLKGAHPQAALHMAKTLIDTCQSFLSEKEHEDHHESVTLLKSEIEQIHSEIELILDWENEHWNNEKIYHKAEHMKIAKFIRFAISKLSWWNLWKQSSPELGNEIPTEIWIDDKSLIWATLLRDIYFRIWWKKTKAIRKGDCLDEKTITWLKRRWVKAINSTAVSFRPEILQQKFTEQVKWEIQNFVDNCKEQASDEVILDLRNMVTRKVKKLTESLWRQWVDLWDEAETILQKILNSWVIETKMLAELSERNEEEFEIKALDMALAYIILKTIKGNRPNLVKTMVGWHALDDMWIVFVPQTGEDLTSEAIKEIKKMVPLYSYLIATWWEKEDPWPQALTALFQNEKIWPNRSVSSKFSEHLEHPERLPKKITPVVLESINAFKIANEFSRLLKSWKKVDEIMQELNRQSQDDLWNIDVNMLNALKSFFDKWSIETEKEKVPDEDSLKVEKLTEPNAILNKIQLLFESNPKEYWFCKSSLDKMWEEWALAFITAILEKVNKWEVHTFYQPILPSSVYTKPWFVSRDYKQYVLATTCKFEWLARMYWIDEKLISPWVFMPIVEIAWAVPKVTMAILKQESLNLSAYSSLNTTVNISQQDLTEWDDLIKMLEIVPEQVRGRMTVELLETITIDAIKAYKSTIKQIKEMWFEIALDDFVLNAKQLEELRDWSEEWLVIEAHELIRELKWLLNTVKLDMSFVKAILSTKNSRATVWLFIRSLQQKWIKIVAEWIEITDPNPSSDTPKWKTFSVDWKSVNMYEEAIDFFWPLWVAIQWFCFSEPKPVDDVLWYAEGLKNVA